MKRYTNGLEGPGEKLVPSPPIGENMVREVVGNSLKFSRKGRLNFRPVRNLMLWLFCFSNKEKKNNLKIIFGTLTGSSLSSPTRTSLTALFSQRPCKRLVAGTVTTFT